MDTPNPFTNDDNDSPATTTGMHRRVTGAAVCFDPAALRSWLHQPAHHDGDNAGELGIGEYFGRAHGTLLAGLDDLLAALTDDEHQSVWLLQPGVTYAGLLRTYDGEGCDGAIIVADLDNGQRLASLHHDHKDFASRDSHGTDAAVEALSSLADTANRIVDQYRICPGRHGQVTDRHVCIYGLTESQFRGLETAIGLPPNGLGRYKPWSAPDGVHLHSQYDLDAAIGYAHRTGLRYSETRETSYEAVCPSGPPARTSPR